MSNSNSKIPSVDTKPDMIKELKEIVDSNESSSSTMQEKRNIPKKHKIRRKTSIRPIIMLLSLCLFLGFIDIDAQITASVKIGATYSDNVFHLSEYDINRFDDHHPNLDFVDTMDDLTLSTRIELGYPMSYRWWKFTPSITSTLSQNISNEDKYRYDWAAKFRVDRYYWNCSIQYASSPYIYFRHFIDTDGTKELEKYNYSRDTFRGDLAVKPFPKTTLKADLRYDIYRYNEYFTEADGKAFAEELGVSYKFPYFTIEGSYAYRDFSCDKRIENKDCSYQSNTYKGKIVLPKMPLESKSETLWQPSLTLNYEQKYYQGGGSWYGGRADYTYTLSAGMNILFSPKWNLSLDYSHLFRNVETDNESVLRLKEYNENRLSAALRFKF
ncbi:MAG TPA: hypothetical protein P5518_00975 [Candidatus Cloacimonas sp.]|jgi:hypothetical protein|nr:hypothetical protein [Candidatus Cloacimonas sp.]MDD2249529.1 hypothetical protein [Candidatus Cloacimonadota bacterium]MCK9157203.1 hypothetical protein [Candidatus Cloacimonas sp.]MCK9164524.1 hypothetical protein [Candidatus Cloacimonas sp.]MDD3733373.1 hypothetical protein [Candidatus Cloacimonadota bacterium]